MQHAIIAGETGKAPVRARPIEDGGDLYPGEVRVTNYVEGDVWDTALGTTRALNDSELLVAARTEKLAALKALRDRIQYDAYEWPADSGIWYQSGEISQTKIIGRSHAADSLRVTYPAQFIDADNNVRLFNSVEEILDWSATLHEFVSQCYVAAAVLENAIKTDPDPANFSLNTGAPWPKTRVDLTGV